MNQIEVINNFSFRFESVYKTLCEKKDKIKIIQDSIKSNIFDQFSFNDIKLIVDNFPKGKEFKEEKYNIRAYYYFVCLKYYYEKLGKDDSGLCKKLNHQIDLFFKFSQLKDHELINKDNDDYDNDIQEIEHLKDLNIVKTTNESDDSDNISKRSEPNEIYKYTYIDPNSWKMYDVYVQG